LLLAGVVPAARQATFRTGVRTVAVYATVSDREGRLVPDLDRAAFEIRDNGQPEPVTVFSNESQAITVAVMLVRGISRLHELYTIGFPPVAWDGRTHGIAVRVKRPGVTVRARAGYVADLTRATGSRD
jgi:hypothetical protein